MTLIPKEFESVAGVLKERSTKLAAQIEKKYKIEPYPQIPKKTVLQGKGAAKAYPIQGILKYHGMSDWNARIAFQPSISFNNDAAYTMTAVEFDPALKSDEIWINGKIAEGREVERVQQTLDYLRNATGAKTRARVRSANVVRATKTGKGLGTSASAAAALALAAIEAALGKEFSSNMRFVTTVSRYLAGSGCRSAAGGVSLWNSYPGIPHENSYALRLDNKKEFEDIDLITVPIDSRIGIKTEDAHKDAPKSPFFETWLRFREGQLQEAMRAIDKKDWETIGRLAEQDTILLHGVTMGGNPEMILWEPETIHLMRATKEMRQKGIPVYFSVDTGPTVVFLTHKKYTDKVEAYIRGKGFEDIVRGKIAGPATVVDWKEAEQSLKK